MTVETIQEKILEKLNKVVNPEFFTYEPKFIKLNKGSWSLILDPTEKPIELYKKYSQEDKNSEEYKEGLDYIKYNLINSIYIIIADDPDHIEVTLGSDLPSWDFPAGGTWEFNYDCMSEEDNERELADLLNSIEGAVSDYNIYEMILDQTGVDPRPNIELESKEELTEAPKPIKFDSEMANSGLAGDTNIDIRDISRKNIEDEKAEEMKRRGEEIITEIKNDPQLQKQDPTDAIEAFTNRIVPSKGKADTVAGEIVRALNKIIYRYWNDGDFYYIGYGIETAGPAATYLCRIADEFKDRLESIPGTCGDNDKRYDTAIKNFTKQVMDYLFSNPDLFATPNKNDMLYFDGNIWKEYEPKYDLDIDYSPKIQAYYDSGKIDVTDIEHEIEAWLDNESHPYDSVNATSYYVELTGLDKETFNDYDHWASTDQLWTVYEDELKDEYGSPFGDVTIEIPESIVALAGSEGIDLQEEICDYIGIDSSDVEIESTPAADGGLLYLFDGINTKEDFDALNGFDVDDFCEKFRETHVDTELD